MFNIGMGAFVPLDKVIMVLDWDSQSIQKYYNSLPQHSKLSTCKGRKANSLVILSNGMAAKSIIGSVALKDRWLKHAVHRTGQRDSGLGEGEGLSEICDDPP